MQGSTNTCYKAVMNSWPTCEPKIHIGVNDLIWLLPVLSSWCPYFKWLCQMAQLITSIPKLQEHTYTLHHQNSMYQKRKSGAPDNLYLQPNNNATIKDILQDLRCPQGCCCRFKSSGCHTVDYFTAWQPKVMNFQTTNFMEYSCTDMNMLQHLWHAYIS
jgi:hypothetical protein